MNRYENLKGKSLSRRRFVQGLVAGGMIAGFDLWQLPAFATSGIGEPAVLTGSHFDLVVDETPVNFTGRSAVATAINGSIPGPLLRWREGDTVTISVLRFTVQSASMN
jgi:FtsP/CotA-like multicopper oxidase with cupredoxin domain